MGKADFFINFVMLSIMRMKSHLDNAVFLHLFSDDTSAGLKFLTHDTSIDYIDYVYKCQKLILAKRSELDISDTLFSLVRGFVFGPQWTDFEGKPHSFHLSSEEPVAYFETTGKHPLNSPDFEPEFQAFRNSIRFRSGKLDKFFREDMVREFPSLQLKVSGSLKGADMYTDTRALREAFRLILKSMQEYGSHPDVIVSYLENEGPDELIKSTITITQVGSLPVHPLSRDMVRLREGDGGTFGTIRKLLDGLCEWSVCSRWPDREGADRWRILRNETEPELSPAKLAEGFSHIISIYHKP